jgi:hypothetical protein
VELGQLPGDGQFVQAVHGAVVLAGHLVECGGEGEGGHPAEERGVGDLEFHARQGLAEALVHAETEGDVVAGVAFEVEAVRGGNANGSRLPRSVAMITPSPALIVWPAMSMSSVATRLRPSWVMVR